MNNSEFIKNLEVAYNATFDQGGQNFSNSTLQHESFGRILDQFSLKYEKNKFAFTAKNEGGSWATFICPMESFDTSEGKHKITILLHWGMKYEFLDDLTSWGHEKCSYRVDDIDHSVIEHFTKEDETNYWSLYDAIVLYKETGKWSVIN